jgi:hypothetical protein
MREIDKLRLKEIFLNIGSAIRSGVTLLAFISVPTCCLAVAQMDTSFSDIVSIALSDAQRSGQYVGIGTSQMMMSPPIPTDPPVIEVVQ